jgi:hypothetical protein
MHLFCTEWKHSNFKCLCRELFLKEIHELKEKLNRDLNRDFFTESHVPYILSYKEIVVI